MNQRPPISCVYSRYDLKDAVMIADKSDIKEGCRVFYELGEWFDKQNKLQFRFGYFKEIENVTQWLKSDLRLNDLDYLIHHNFMILKP